MKFQHIFQLHVVPAGLQVNKHALLLMIYHPSGIRFFIGVPVGGITPYKFPVEKNYVIPLRS
jgi:hypothetical protein